MKIWVLIFLSLISYNLSAQSPGGVSTNLRWWLKADAGVLNPSLTPAANGEEVSQWNDQSLIVNNATQGTSANRPIFQTNISNGNPVLRFSGNQFIDAGSAPGIGSTESFYYFLVLKQSSYTAGGTGDGAGSYLLDRTTDTNNLTSIKMVNTDKYFLQKRNDDNSGIGGPISTTAASTSSFVVLDFYRNFGTEYGLFLNGRNDATSGDDASNLTAPTLRIGRHTDTNNGGMHADLAEFIVYNTNISTTDLKKIESYLAIKYGITLNQTISTDYVSAAGTVVYPATTSHDSHDYDIAGIGNETASGLNQTSSQSQNTQSLVRIFNPSSLGDGDFLLWGHDSPNIWNSNNAPPGFANRLTRVWRAAETGDVGTVSVSFDLSSLGVDFSDPTKFALLIDSDGNFSDATVHTTGRTIVGSTVSFTLANINNNEYFTIATDLIPGPGGVAGSVVWLRADASTYLDAGATLATDGQLVQQWNNEGQPAYNVSQSSAANRPTLRTGIFNSNSVLRFTSSGATHTFLDFGSMGITSSSDLNFTMVFQPSVLNGGAVNDGTGGYIIDRNPTTSSTTPLAGFKLVNPNLVGFQKRSDGGGGLGGVSTTTSVSTTIPQIVDYYRDYGIRYGIYYNGTQEATSGTDPDGPLTLPNMRIGAHYDGNKGFNGDIAEFVFYNRDISASERNRIDSYLAIKYGITLNQSTLTNYTASSGTVVYQVTTTHSTYRFDIAGIGRDDVSKLNQTSSQSVNAGSIVSVQNPSALQDQEFLIWGDNNGNITTPNSVDVDGATILRRLSRIWKTAETGDVGTVDISFDLTNVPGAKFQADLRLLIDRNLNGFADNDVAPITGTLVGEIFTITGVDFQHGDLFTVGTVALSTPLPVDLISFEAKQKASIVELTWATATELNSDFFTIERSPDGVNFEFVTQIKSAGNTTEESHYITYDLDPNFGRTYYRLTQTDLDGTFERLAISRVDITGGVETSNVRMFPNPSSGGNFTLVLPEISKGARVDIINQLGRIVHSENHTSKMKSFEMKGDASYTPGIYFVRVAWGNHIETLKLVIEN